MSNRFAVALLALLCTCSAASAGIILQNTGNATLATNIGIAQSFVAEDPRVLFAFSYRALNPNSINTPLELRLLQGDGVAGAVLADVFFTLPASYVGFYDVDLSSVVLTAGLSYTASISSQSNVFGIDVAYTTSGSDPYPNGRAYFPTGPSAAFPDTRFRVKPISGPAAIPEPATLALLGLGVLAAAAGRRRRHKVDATTDRDR